MKTLNDILNQHAAAVRSVVNGELDLCDSQPLFDELYDYYVNSGEMPYGIAKARDGDPSEWIFAQLEQYYYAG